MSQETIRPVLQPLYREKTLARMLQDGSVDRDLNIVISQRQRKVEEGRHVVDDGEKDRERTPQREVDGGEEEDEFPMAGYPFHSTPNRKDEKQFSGEIPKWRTVLISRSNF